MKFKPFPLAFALLLYFGVLANGAHDIWAATVVWLACLTAFSLLLWQRPWGKKKLTRRLDYSLLLSIVLGVFFVSYKLSINPSESFMEWMDWLCAVFVFWTALHVFRNESDLRSFLLILIPLFWIQFAASLVQLVIGIFYFEMKGTLINANILATFLLIWLPPYLDQTVQAYKSNNRNFLLHLSALLSIGGTIVLSGSFVAAFCAMFGFLLMGFHYKPKLKHEYKKFLAPALGILVLFSVVTILWKLNPMEDEAGFIRENFERFYWWQAGFAMVKDFPFFGVGLGNFPSGYLSYKVGAGQHTLFAHSFPLTILFETGIVGFLSLFTFFLIYFNDLRSYMRQHTIRISFLVGIVLFLLFSLVNIGFEYLINLLILFMFMGIVAASIEKPGVSIRKSVSVLVVVLCLGLTPFLISAFMASQNVVAAEHHMRQRNFEGAHDALSAAVELDPQSWRAYQLWAQLAFIGYREGVTAEEGEEPVGLLNAYHLQKRAIELNKRHAPLYWEMGHYLLEAGKKEEAFTHFRRAIHLRPNFDEYEKQFKEIRSTASEG